MTTGNPTPHFEVYPPAAEAGLEPAPAAPAGADPTPMWEQQPEPAPASLPAPYLPPVPQPPSAGPSRRGIIGLVIAIPAGGIILSAIGRSDGGSEEDADPFGEYTDDGEWMDEQPTIDIAGYSADLPDGWELTTLSDDEVVVTRGKNRLQAYHFTSDDGDLAVDMVAALTKRRMGDFEGTLGAPVGEEYDTQHATVEATGTFEGKKARLTGQLWIDAEGEALLVVTVLTSKVGSSVAEEADAMVEELASGF